MAANFNLLCVVFFLAIIGKGYCQCSIENLVISQSKTGQQINNKPQWKVAISNDCPCVQLQVKLACNGFQSTEKVDPSVLSQSDGECLVDNGQPVNGFTFTYSWDTMFPFKVISSQIACS